MVPKRAEAEVEGNEAATILPSTWLHLSSQFLPLLSALGLGLSQSTMSKQWLTLLAKAFIMIAIEAYVHC